MFSFTIPVDIDSGPVEYTVNNYVMEVPWNFISVVTVVYVVVAPHPSKWQFYVILRTSIEPVAIASL